MKIKVLVMMAIALVITSCSQKSYTYRSTYIHNPNVIVNDIVVDLEVDFSKKIVSNSIVRKSLKDAKDEAYYKAIVENNIDIVVDPIFETTTTGKKFQVKLTGFGAKYINPRNKIEVIKALKSVDTTDIKKYQMLYEGLGVDKKISSIALPKLSSKTSEEPLKLPLNDKKIKKPKRFGAKLGYATSTFKFDGEELSSSGFYVGLTQQLQTNSRLNLRIDYSLAIYDELQEVSLPLYLKFDLNNKISVLGGGYLSFLNFSTDDIQIASYGISFGASYSITNSLAADLLYFAPIGSKNSDDDPFKYLNSSLGLGFSYRF